MSKIIYISGSTQHDNTGVGPYGTEEARMQTLADKVKYYLEKGKGDFVIYRNNGNMNLSQTIDDSNSKNPDIHVALHTNAGGGKGTECYYYGTSPIGKRLADFVYNAVAPLTINSDRGCKSDFTLYSNGLAETRETTAIACLIEIMFHDNYVDVADYLTKIDTIALAIAKSLYSYFGIEYKIEYAPVTTEREKAIKMICQVSKWAEDYIREFDAIQAKGINVWGLINKFKV
jgi:N-acetylmuramoyl-L-alanine amidase